MRKPWKALVAGLVLTAAATPALAFPLAPEWVRTKNNSVTAQFANYSKIPISCRVTIYGVLKSTNETKSQTTTLNLGSFGSRYMNDTASLVGENERDTFHDVHADADCRYIYAP